MPRIVWDCSGFGAHWDEAVPRLCCYGLKGVFPMAKEKATISKRPCVLIIRDGWGFNPDAGEDDYNAARQAHTPTDDMLMADYPHCLIHTYGDYVGMPDGTLGNSEVGHQNIGAGRTVPQESVRLTHAIRDGSFF